MCPCVYVCPYFPNRLGDEMSFSRIKSARMCGAIACAYYGCHVSYSEITSQNVWARTNSVIDH